MEDKTKYSLASKKKWSQIPAAERSERMRRLALKRWSKMSVAERKKYSRKMNAAKLLGNKK